MTNPPRKKFETLKSAWYVWLFPAFAVLICLWLVFDHFNQEGTMVHIRFEDGSSIQAEKTRVRFRGITVGVVKKVYLADNDKEVVADVALESSAENFAREGSKFWVVTPKVNFQGVSGLETIFEGTYIAALPGKPEAKPQHDFKGKLSSETDESIEDTVAYYLETPNADSVNVGDSVTFRGLKVGTVTKVTLGKSAQSIVVQINVQNRYVRLIRTNTVFWRKVGIQADLGLFKSQVKINSLESLLRGGIDFFTPNEVGPIAKAQSKFTLNTSPPKDWDKWNPSLD